MCSRAQEIPAPVLSDCSRGSERSLRQRQGHRLQVPPSPRHRAPGRAPAPGLALLVSYPPSLLVLPASENRALALPPLRLFLRLRLPGDNLSQIDVPGLITRNTPCGALSMSMRT